MPNPPEKVKPLVKLFAELEKEIQSNISPWMTTEGAGQSPFIARVAEEAAYPEKIAQLYDLDEMVKHYHDLEELYTGLESGGENEEHFNADTGDVHVDTDVVEDVATVEICNVASARKTSANQVIPNQSKSKSAVLLREIKLSLDALLTKEDIEKLVSNDMETLAHNENDTWCKARCFVEQEDDTLTTANDKGRARKKSLIRKQNLRSRRYHKGRKRWNKVVQL